MSRSHAQLAVASDLAAATVRAEGVYVLTVKGTIGPASADYLVRGIDRAAQARAREEEM